MHECRNRSTVLLNLTPDQSEFTLLLFVQCVTSIHNLQMQSATKRADKIAHIKQRRDRVLASLVIFVVVCCILVNNKVESNPIAAVDIDECDIERAADDDDECDDERTAAAVE